MNPTLRFSILLLLCCSATLSFATNSSGSAILEQMVREVEQSGTDAEEIRYIVDEGVDMNAPIGPLMHVSPYRLVYYRFTRDGVKELYPCKSKGRLYTYGQVFEDQGFYYTCQNRTGRLISSSSFAPDTWSKIDAEVRRYELVHGVLTTQYSEKTFTDNYFFKLMVGAVREKLNYTEIELEQEWEGTSNGTSRFSVPDVNTRKLYGYFKNQAFAQQNMPLNDTLIAKLSEKEPIDAGGNYLNLPDPILNDLDEFLNEYSAEFQVLPRDYLMKTEAFLLLHIKVSPKLTQGSHSMKIKEEFVYGFIEQRLSAHQEHKHAAYFQCACLY